MSKNKLISNINKHDKRFFLNFFLQEHLLKKAANVEGGYQEAASELFQRATASMAEMLQMIKSIRQMQRKGEFHEVNNKNIMKFFFIEK